MKIYNFDTFNKLLFIYIKNILSEKMQFYMYIKEPYDSDQGNFSSYYQLKKIYMNHIKRKIMF